LRFACLAAVFFATRDNIIDVIALLVDGKQGALGRLATWHLPGEPVGPPAGWAATSNVEAGSETEERPWALSKGGEGSTRINYWQGSPSS